MLRTRFAALAVSMLGLAAFAQPEAKQAEAVPAEFRSFICVDQRTDIKNGKNRTNKQHCLVTENALNPTIAVFCRKTPAAGDALSKLALDLKALMAKEKYKAMNFGSYMIFLTLDMDFNVDEKRDEAKKAVVDWAGEIGKDGGIGNLVLGLSGKDVEFVKKWNLAADDEITVVLYHRLKVVERWKFAEGKFGEGDVKTILDAAETELKKK